MSTITVKFEDVCMRMRHDFGLLTDQERQEMISQVSQAVAAYSEEFEYQQNRKKNCMDCFYCCNNYSPISHFQGCSRVGADNSNNHCDKFCGGE